MDPRPCKALENQSTCNALLKLTRFITFFRD
ncbi:hypothetical protein ACJIZ3_022337 [Penstemon smallii]|uniref:Uncharacterized protein n=1 Tax=Penstemon smallii TaxID=265156 RepID=A0ABD3TMB8_9LAMI